MADMRGRTDPDESGRGSWKDIKVGGDGRLHVSNTDADGHNFDRSERPTIGTSVVQLTEQLRQGHSFAQITVETAAIRVRVTGENPTATAGKIFEVGDLIRLENEHEIAKFRAIRKDAVSATIDVEYGS